MIRKRKVLLFIFIIPDSINNIYDTLYECGVLPAFYKVFGQWIFVFVPDQRSSFLQLSENVIETGDHDDTEDGPEQHAA
jgi:hypothetical protein